MLYNKKNWEINSKLPLYKNNNNNKFNNYNYSNNNKMKGIDKPCNKKG